MKYILVQNKTTVLLGPFLWNKYRMFQTELTDLFNNGEMSTQFQVPVIEVGYIDCGNGFEIFPIVDSSGLDGFNDYHHEMSGPYYNYVNNEAIETWTILPLNLDKSKEKLKELAATIRHQKEIAGTTVKINGQTVSVFTDRVNRHQYNLLLSSMGSIPINFKFKEGFISITALDVQSIISTVNDYVQAQFDLEKDIWDQIDNSTTAEELQAINILPVTQPNIILKIK